MWFTVASAIAWFRAVFVFAMSTLLISTRVFLRRAVQLGVLVIVLPIWVLVLAIIWLPIVIRGMMRRHWRSSPSVVFGPVASINSVGYARSLRERGVDARTVVYRLDPIMDQSDIDLILDRMECDWLLRQVLPYALLVYLLLRHDIFVHFFNVDGYLAGTWLRYIEFPLLRFFGKSIICMAYGSDVQTRGRMEERLRPFYEDLERESRVRRNVAHTAHWASYKISGGDLYRHMPYDICIHLLSVDVEAYTPAYPRVDNSGPVRIVHATGHRHLKGSDAIERACEDLRKQGLNIDYVFVSGLPNREARRIYATADIIVDQLLLGCYGMFAVEGMALGKPVVSYLADDVIAANPTYPFCPIVNAGSETIVSRLRELVVDSTLRHELGRRSRRYVEAYHDPKFTGQVLLAICRRVWFGPAEPDPVRLVADVITP